MTSSAQKIAEQVRSGEQSAEQIAAAAFEIIQKHEPRLAALLALTEEHARERAGTIERAREAGEPLGPLAGVPIILKDNICTPFGATTCASKILAEFRAPYAATVVERIEAAGGVIIGKANLDEFAMGSSTENSGVKPSRNPWNTDCVPGGSSGGSAVAVAAGYAPLALGSDTGGSIRQPASFCGVVGLKPSYGRVSRYGLVAYGSSLDQIGPFARDVADAALLLGVMAGKDERDATSVAEDVPDYVGLLSDAALDARVGSLRVGVIKEFFAEGLGDEVRQAVEAAIEVYRGLGAEIVELSLPHLPYSIATYYLIATAECSSNLARFDGVHYGHRTAEPRDVIDLYSSSRAEGFGDEVKRRIMLGAFALSAGYYDAYYSRALKVRRLIKQDFDRAFEQADVLVSPTAPTPAFRFGEKTEDPLAMYLADVYTIAANLAGVPGVSLPCGFSADGLPIGMQLMAPVFGEAQMLQAARVYERATDWHLRRPPM